MQVSFDFETEQGIRRYAEFIDRGADLVIRYGGSLSGEHGDGQSRGALLPKMFGPELMRAFGEFKAVWDPHEPDEPAQADRRVSADGESAARRRLPPGRSRRRSSRFPTTRDRSPRRRCGASGWASAASTTTGRCARATWRRSKSATARAAARACCGSFCRTRC